MLHFKLHQVCSFYGDYLAPSSFSLPDPPVVEKAIDSDFVIAVQHLVIQGHLTCKLRKKLPHGFLPVANKFVKMHLIFRETSMKNMIIKICLGIISEVKNLDII